MSSNGKKALGVLMGGYEMDVDNDDAVEFIVGLLRLLERWEVDELSLEELDTWRDMDGMAR